MNNPVSPSPHPCCLHGALFSAHHFNLIMSRRHMEIIQNMLDEVSVVVLYESQGHWRQRERERESKRKRESKHDTDSNLKLGLCRVANWGQDREPLLYPELLTILLQSRGHRTEPVITTLRHHLLDDMSSWQFVCLFMNHAIPGEIHLHEGKTQRRSNTHRLLLLFSVALYCIHYIRPHHLHYR